MLIGNNLDITFDYEEATKNVCLIPPPRDREIDIWIWLGIYFFEMF